MNKMQIKYDDLEKRLIELKKLIFNSKNLKENIDHYEYKIEQLRFEISNFDNKYGFDEADKLYRQIEKIDYFIKNYFKNEDRKINETLSYMFGDELEDGDFPDSFDTDDFFGNN